MPAANPRPKQRTLIRWNDDLDKSLLLFIAHTCTELGIKIPYDEIGRRMGSNFSEGAIVQHIAKLRSKMADLNVAPVPAPPKRGQIASRPSTVYTTKARAGPPPLQPATTTKGRGRRAQTAKPTGVTKARAFRKGNGRTIKRSESDVDDDDEEEDYEIEDGIYPSTSSGRARRSSDQSNPDRRVSNAHPGRSQVGKAISGLFATDTSDSGASPFTFPSYSFPQDQSAFPYVSIEQNQAQSPYDYNDDANYAPQEGSAGDEEDEEEEDDSLPLMARKAALQGQAYHLSAQSQTSDNISPRSQSQMGPPMHNGSFSQFAGNQVGFLSLGLDHQQQQLPQSRAYSSSTLGNFDYSSFDTTSGTKSPSVYTTPSSPFPTAMPSNLPGPASSQASSRNDSLVSRNQYGTPNLPHTPLHVERVNGVNGVFSPSAPQPMSSPAQDDLLNQAIATTLEVQPTSMNWDFSNCNEDSNQLPNFLHDLPAFSNDNGYEDATEMFFKSMSATNMDQMDYSGNSQ